VNNVDFVFHCMSCNCQTNLDESLNGECPACSGAVQLSVNCKMSQEEVARRKKRKKLMKKAKARAKHERSTIERSTRWKQGSVSITLLVGTVIVLLSVSFVDHMLSSAERHRQADQLISLELQAHAEALQTMRQREAAEHQVAAENAAGQEKARQVMAEIAVSIEQADRLIEQADEMLLEEFGFQEGE